MFNRTLNSFVPSVYKGFLEMDELINSEEEVMKIARGEMFSTFFNTFVLTSNEEGVIMFERMLNIVANPHTEDLDFRKQRIINRLSMNSVYTFRYLKQKLNELIGVNLWKAYIDFDDYALYIESSTANQSWYHEVEFTINRIKPCNITFINRPYSAFGISINEEVAYTTPLWRYRLGSWKLGEYPFATPNGGGVVKMAEIPSIQQALLDGTANFLSDDVAYVLINDSIEIRDFRIKQSEGEVVTIEYSVTTAMTNLITNIKLMRADNTVLTQSVVYIPVTNTVISKHTITLKEGV